MDKIYDFSSRRDGYKNPILRALTEVRTFKK